MKKFNVIYNLAAFLLAAVIFSSCSTTGDDYTTAIPADAKMIITADLGSIAAKGQLDKIEELQTYKMAKMYMAMLGEEANKEIESFMKDPGVTGIDFKSKMYFYMLEKNMTVGVLFKLTDGAKFSSFVEKMSKMGGDKGPEIKKEGDISIIAEGGSIVGWDNSKLLILASTTGQDVSTQFKEYMAAASDKSINSNENYAEFTKNPMDVGFWMNYDFMAKLQEMNPAMKQMPEVGAMYGKMADLFKDSYYHIYVDFANGEIKMTGAFYPNPELAKKFDPEKLVKPGMSEKILNVVPGDKVFGSLAFAVNMKEYVNAIMEFIPKEYQADKLNEMIKTGTQGQLTFDDIVNFFDGEFLITFNGMKTVTSQQTSYDMEGKETMEEVSNPFPLVTMAFTVNDDKLYNVLQQMLPALGNMVKPRGSNFEIEPEPGMKIYAGMQDKLFVITTSEEVIDNLGKGFGDKGYANTDIGKKLLQMPSYMYMNLNLETYPDEIKNMLKDEMGFNYKAFADVMKNFNSISMESTKDMKFVGSLKFSDDKNNSLYTIITMIDNAVASAAGGGMM